MQISCGELLSHGQGWPKGLWEASWVRTGPVTSPRTRRSSPTSPTSGTGAPWTTWPPLTSCPGLPPRLAGTLSTLHTETYLSRNSAARRWTCDLIYKLKLQSVLYILSDGKIINITFVTQYTLKGFQGTTIKWKKWPPPPTLLKLLFLFLHQGITQMFALRSCLYFSLLPTVFFRRRHHSFNDFIALQWEQIENCHIFRLYR